MPANLSLSKLLVYPVKSCSPCEGISEWALSETGLKYDRCWMIVNEFGVFMTQRKHPKLCFIKTRFDFKNNKLCLTYDDIVGYEISVPLDIDETSAENIRITENKLWAHNVLAADCGDEIADWLSDYIDIPGLRLVRDFKTQRRNTKNILLKFTDDGQVLLVTESSVSWLAGLLQDYPYINLTQDSVMRRFRPNFVISGNVEPLAEMSWKNVTIGSASFKLQEECRRCQMICINQATSEKDKEILSTLTDGTKGKIIFGIYLSLSTEACNKSIKINDLVKVNEKDKY